MRWQTQQRGVRIACQHLIVSFLTFDETRGYELFFDQYESSRPYQNLVVRNLISNQNSAVVCTEACFELNELNWAEPHRIKRANLIVPVSFTAAPRPA